MDIFVFAYFQTSDFGSDFATKIQFGHGLTVFSYGAIILFCHIVKLFSGSAE